MNYNKYMPKEKEKRTYKTYANCLNCDYAGDTEVKMGDRVVDTPCPKCGTKMLSIYKEFGV